MSGQSLRCLCWLLAWQLVAGGGLLEGQRARPRVDFLDEQLVIPDSEKFTSAEYIESGVGLSFGVDRRLTYNIGQYREAVQRFEAAIGQFKYKSEIWVYLARAYFYDQNPEKARQVLEQAAAVMPDLRERLWQPLLDTLLEEIRRRANQLQVQVDFYSQGQDDFLSLFRLYRFLQDHQQAIGVIRTAEERMRRMNELAGMAAGNTRQTYLAQAIKWRDLAQRLRSELDSTSVEQVPPAARDTTVSDSLKLAETIRLLQLRVDFYRATLQEYRELFETYLRLGRREQAARVVEALEREAQRVALQIGVASDVQEEGRYQERAEELERLRQQLREQLDAGGPP